MSFTSNGTGSPVTDVDGNSYATIWIGGQNWMKENLKTTHYKDATEIQLVTDAGIWAGLTTGAYCYYDNNAANAATYGALYNWYAVNTGKLCPTGWHVPTDAEWYTLENYVDPTINNPNATGWRGTDGGAKLKATSGWYNNGNGTDNYGFSALPGGNRDYYGAFGDIGYYGYWWSATEYGAANAWIRFLGYYDARVSRYYYGKYNGFSVRCLRDY